MMKNIIVFLVLLSAIKIHAQEKHYKYYDQDLDITYDAKKVAFFSILEFEDNVLQNNIIIYDLDGKIKSYQRFSNYQKMILEGVSEEFYENGQVKQQKNYTSNKEEGKQFYFWENGTLKREEIYSKGAFIDGRCYDESGNKIEYYPLSVRAIFQDDMSKFYNYVAKNINTRLIKNEGQMRVSFVIDTNGSVQNIKIIRDTNDPNLTKNVIGVLSKCPNWIPGSFDGKLISTLFTLPINLAVGEISFPNSSNSNNDSTPYFESQIIRF